MSNLKFSIITVCYNSEKTIRETLQSLIAQKYSNIELIIVDGLSNDKTLDIIQEYKENFDVIISEKDTGMYDALNKGILASTGDIIGILNSDDTFSNDNVIKVLANEFQLNPKIDALIGDIAFIENRRVVRYYSSKNWGIKKFRFGIMPPHPTFYCKRDLFYKYGFYDKNFKIAGDFELLLRFMLVNKINYKYIPMQMVNMKLGGLSTSGIKSLAKINREIILAFKVNSLKTNYLNLCIRYLLKVLQFLN